MFKFGTRSTSNLKGVHEDLIQVAKTALEISNLDFAITEGLRTEARQQELFNQGATTTLRSRHLTGHAIDVAPYVAGKVRFDWPLFYKLAVTFQGASIMHGINIVWGGVWDRSLHQLDSGDIAGEVTRYAARRQKAGKVAFLDGPHFQLHTGEYPC